MPPWKGEGKMTPGMRFEKAPGRLWAGTFHRVPECPECTNIPGVTGAWFRWCLLPD